MQRNRIISPAIASIFIFAWLISGPLFSQDVNLNRNYSLSFRNNTFRQVLDSIQTYTNLGFSYNPDYIGSIVHYTGNFTKQPLHAILDSVFGSFGLTYKLVGTTIAVSGEKNAGNQTANTTTEAPALPDTAKIYEYSGKVCDHKGRKPIPFANIYFKNQTVGTISNADGYFVLKVPERLQHDTVVFSFIGYQSVRKCAADLDTGTNQVILEPFNYELKEVTIRNYKPEEIIKKAIENIPQNYSNEPQLYTAFYRETLQKNREYVDLSEAVILINKAAYTSYANDRAKIYKGRRTRLTQKNDTIAFKLQGGIYTSLLLDIAKNNSNFMSNEYFPYYNFSIEDITSINGNTVYVIAFDQKENVNYPLFTGKIYIDTETLAIVRADFMLSPKGISEAAGMLVRKSPRGMKVKPVESHYTVDYSLNNNKWYLSHVSEEIKFKIRRRFKIFNAEYNSVAEMVVTEIDSVGSPKFKLNETVRPNDIFTENLGTYDPGFWGNFNYIKPEESLVEAIKENAGRLRVK